MLKPVVTVLITSFLLFVSTVGAEVPAPEKELRSVVGTILSILNDPALQEPARSEERNDRLFDTAFSIFDSERLAMGALGSNWKRFSGAQQKRFSDYFARLIAESYFTKMEGKSFENITVSYLKTEILPATKSGIERADVFTEIVQEKIATPVDYRMLKDRDGEWKIYDVKIEGVSMIANYREQYRNRFTDPPESLIQELREKVEP